MDWNWLKKSNVSPLISIKNNNIPQNNNKEGRAWQQSKGLNYIVEMMEGFMLKLRNNFN